MTTTPRSSHSVARPSVAGAFVLLGILVVSSVSIGPAGLVHQKYSKFSGGLNTTPRSLLRLGNNEGSRWTILPARSSESPPASPSASRPQTWGTTAIASARPIDVLHGPTSAVYDGGDGYVYASYFAANYVAVLSGTEVIATLNVSGPGFGAYDSSDGDVYVPNALSTNVSLLHGTNLIGSVDDGVGTGPGHATYDSQNGYVYVTNPDTFNVSVIRGAALVASIEVGENPEKLAFDSVNGFVYVSCALNLFVIDGLKVVGVVDIGGGSPDPVPDSGSGLLYALNRGDNSHLDNVSVFDGASLVGTIVVGSLPASAAYDNGNGDLYVTNSGSGNVSVIKGMTVVASVNVGIDPVCAVYDDGNGEVYVTNFGSNTVSVLGNSRVVGSVNVSATAPWYLVYDGDNGDVYVLGMESQQISVIGTPNDRPSDFSETYDLFAATIGTTVAAVVIAGIWARGKQGSSPATYVRSAPGEGLLLPGPRIDREEEKAR